jgi:hypothetical protein
MTVNRTSVWHCKEGYGILLTNHPKLDFATGISSADGGRSSGGSVRLNNVSGDFNYSGYMCADGSQTVYVDGIKSENNNPLIAIKGDKKDNDRQRWDIAGFRHEAGTTNPTRNLIEIFDTARPQIFLGAGAGYNIQKIIKILQMEMM